MRRDHSSPDEGNRTNESMADRMGIYLYWYDDEWYAYDARWDYDEDVENRNIPMLENSLQF